MSPENMLELQKLVLENVHESKTLFEKELRKSFRWLGYDDLSKLYCWAIDKFREPYFQLIYCVYKGFGFQIPYKDELVRPDKIGIRN